MTTGVSPSEAVILAGGLGTRLRPAVSDRPKVLAEVAGRPFLDWLLDALERQGVRRVVVSTGHLGHQVERFLRRRRASNLDVTTLHETAPLGTGGALRLALGAVEQDPFVALNGDSICRFDLARLHAVHRRAGARATLWLAHAGDRSQAGSVEIDASGRVLRFAEKRPGAAAGPVSAGVYELSRATVATLPAEGASSLERDLFPSLVGAGLWGVGGDEPLLDIGTPASLAQAGSLIATLGGA